jgi:hypothetical protein
MFCLVLLAMGSTGIVTELLCLLCATVTFVTTLVLLGLWACVDVLSSRWRMRGFLVCGVLLAVSAVFGFTTWIITILRREDIVERLDSYGGGILGRERIIAAGFACWVLLLITQVRPPRDS